jgi:hypothetical protein
MKLTTHLYLVPKLTMHGAIHPFPHTFSWRGTYSRTGTIYLTFFTQPPIQWVPGTRSLGVKQPEREADHSPPSCVEVKE